jgi:peptidoglycan-associated lipoprotein
MKFALMLFAFAFSASAALAQPLPPPLPPGVYPPGVYPPGALPAAPLVPLSVLQADLKAQSGSDTVRFQRESYVLDLTSQQVLARQAQWLLARPWIRANIEGHADGRLTRDYALALGERRAAAVRNFLLAQGVSPGQLNVVSWGRERPTSAALHDATWLQNSRVVTVLKQAAQQQFGPQPLPQPDLPNYR